MSTQAAPRAFAFTRPGDTLAGWVVEADEERLVIATAGKFVGGPPGQLHTFWLNGSRKTTLDTAIAECRERMNAHEKKVGHPCWRRSERHFLPANERAQVLGVLSGFDPQKHYSFGSYVEIQLDAIIPVDECTSRKRYAIQVGLPGFGMGLVQP